MSERVEIRTRAQSWGWRGRGGREKKNTQSLVQYLLETEEQEEGKRWRGGGELEVQEEVGRMEVSGRRDTVSSGHKSGSDRKPLSSF